MPWWKKILLALLALVIILVAMGAFVYSRYLHPTREIVTDLYAVRHDRNNFPMVNFFIMRAGERYIAFDAGYCSEQTEYALQTLNISADDVVAVFITHSDYDHLGSLSLFNNATIYSWDTEFQYAERARNAPVFERPDLPHDTMIDGEVIEIYGRVIQLIYTPGHTSDSVSFLVDNKYLFVGDLFVSLNHAYYNAELQAVSRENVLGIHSVEYVFTGHFGLFRNVRFFRRWFL